MNINNMLTQQQNWEDKLEELAKEYNGVPIWDTDSRLKNALKKFISQHLEKQKEEIVEVIRGEIETYCRTAYNDDVVDTIKDLFSLPALQLPANSDEIRSKFEPQDGDVWQVGDETFEKKDGKVIKKQMKYKIYKLATKIYDWQIPILSWLADKVRDWTYEYKE